MTPHDTIGLVVRDMSPETRSLIVEEQNNETNWINPDFEGRAPTVSNILASWIPQAEVVEGVAAVPAESKPERAKRKTKTPRTTRAASPKKGKTSERCAQIECDKDHDELGAHVAKPKTDEQRRLHKNAAVRAWRQKHAAKFALYMKTWRANKKAQDKKAAKSTTKKAKRIGKAATA